MGLSKRGSEGKIIEDVSRLNYVNTLVFIEIREGGKPTEETEQWLVGRCKPRECVRSQMKKISQRRKESAMPVL